MGRKKDRKSFIGTYEHVLRYRKRERKDCIGDDTWQAIEERRNLKNECNREPEKKEQWRQEYQQKSITVTKKTRRNKRNRTTSRPVKNKEGKLLTLETQQLDHWRITNQDNIATTIKRRKWNWIGHTLRKDRNNITRQTLDYSPPGKRKQDRLRNIWRRSTFQELKNIGMSWKEAKAKPRRE